MSLILASRATVYDRYAISRKFTAQETAINMVQGNIALLVSASEIEELKNGDKTMYSKLSTVEMDLNSITMAVSSSEYKDINGVLSAVSQAGAAIELNTQEIKLKVSKDSLISTINQSAEAITINANKINLNGIVTANQNFKILTDGSMVAKNGVFDGKITTDSINLKNGKLTIDSGILEISNEVYDFACLKIISGGSILQVHPDVISAKKSSDIYITHSVKNGVASYWKNGSKMCSINLSSTGSTFFLTTGEGNAITLEANGTSRFNNIHVAGSLMVAGTKNRIVQTKQYGIITQSSYETAEPMFGDMGHGIINNLGECIIFIDPKYGETVSTEYGYYVFITKYGDGDAWISKKELSTFTVSGTPGLEFDWEIKAHQKGYELDRLRSVDL